MRLDPKDTETDIVSDGLLPPRGRLHRAWGFVAKLVALALVVAIANLAGLLGRGAQPAPPLAWDEPEPPGDLQMAVSQALDEACVTAPEAEGRIRARLGDMGYTEWVISLGPGVRAGGCVSASIQTLEQRILLMMAPRSEVIEALEVAAEELLDRCLGKEDATDLVASVLTSLGETGWEIRSDGPVGAPIGRRDEVMRHFEAGCFSYSGMGWTEDGVRLYFIAGKQ